MNEPRYTAGHLGALRRFAVAITVLNLLGHTVLGFEASYAQPLVALATGYSMQILLELVDAWTNHRRPRFAGGLLPLVDFLLSAHITALAVSMLLYFNEGLLVVAFAVAVSIASKVVFRAPVGNGTRHIFNPSNFGITVTLLLFPSMVGLGIPWQFTQDVPGFVGWAIVGTIFCLGSYVNAVFTRRIPLIAAFVTSFVAQSALRALLFGHPMTSSLSPITGVAAMLFTFYMAPDPATTPDRPWRQVAFGAGIALVYGVLVALHIAFALFYALTIICALRGIGLYLLAGMGTRRTVPEPEVPRLAPA